MNDIPCGRHCAMRGYIPAAQVCLCARDRDPEGANPEGMSGEAIEPGGEATRPTLTPAEKRMSDPKQDEVPLPEPGMQEINPYRDLGPLDPHKGAGLLVWFDRNQLIAYGNARARAATERAAQVARSHLGGGNDGVIHFIAEAIEADVGIKGDGRG